MPTTDPPAMRPKITGISSMATRALLGDLVTVYTEQTGSAVTVEAVGGVDAARRVQAGEPFDIAFLAADAIDRLEAAGAVQAGSRVDLVRSPIAVAVRAGAPRPDIGSEDAVRQAVLAARSLSYSTGPSGVYLNKLFERWGIAAQVQAKLVQAPPGVPVGTLVARGEVELGFQQLSELMHLDGIAVLGLLPEAIAFITTFSAGLCTAAAQPGAARDLLAWLASPATAEGKRRHGMEPA